MTVDLDPYGVPFLAQSERIALGVLNREMVPRLEGWFNDLAVSRTLGVNRHPISTEMKGRHLDDLLRSRDPAFAIYHRGERRLIGLTALEDVNPDNGTAEFMILIGDKEYQGAGYGTETTRLVLAYAFDVLGLYNVWLQVTSNNTAAIRAYERAGFRKIGVRRQSVRIGRQVIDDVYMDAIAADFAPSPLAALLHPPKEAR